MSGMAQATQQSDSTPLSSEQRFEMAWAATFGISPVHVFFPDQELNARVYTLDGESGYNVKHKIAGREEPVEDALLDEADKLVFPAKARRGEEHGRARLKKEDVLKIRSWAAVMLERGAVPAWTAKAAELNVSEGTLRDIVNRRTWIHI